MVHGLEGVIQPWWNGTHGLGQAIEQVVQVVGRCATMTCRSGPGTCLIWSAMKSISACILAVHVLLTSLTPAGLVEFLRAPGLAEHYQEHWEETGGAISWSDFLFMHYVDEAHEEQDGGRHGELPFHKHHVASSPFLTDAGPLAVPSALSAVALHVPFVSGTCGDWPGRSVFHPPKSFC